MNIFVLLITALPIEIHANNSYETDFIRGAIFEDYIYVENEFDSYFRGIQLELRNRIEFKDNISRFVIVGGHREDIPDIAYCHPYYMLLCIKRISDVRYSTKLVDYENKCRKLKHSIISDNGFAILEWLRTNVEDGSYLIYEMYLDVYENPEKYVKLHGHKKGFPKLKKYKAPPAPNYALPWEEGFELTWFEEVR